MKTTKTLVLSLAFVALIGYCVFSARQVVQLQTALEQSQARIVQLHQSVRALQQEQKNPRLRFLSKNESR